jgi:hypothetical protein
MARPLGGLRYFHRHIYLRDTDVGADYQPDGTTNARTDEAHGGTHQAAQCQSVVRPNQDPDRESQ